MQEYCYLGSRITKDERSVSDIKSRLAQARRAFDSMRDLLESNIYLGVKKRFLKSFVWSVDFIQERNLDSGCTGEEKDRSIRDVVLS